MRFFALTLSMVWVTMSANNVTWRRWRKKNKLEHDDTCMKDHRLYLTEGCWFFSYFLLLFIFVVPYLITINYIVHFGYCLISLNPSDSLAQIFQQHGVKFHYSFELFFFAWWCLPFFSVYENRDWAKRRQKKNHRENRINWIRLHIQRFLPKSVFATKMFGFSLLSYVREQLKHIFITRRIQRTQTISEWHVKEAYKVYIYFCETEQTEWRKRRSKKKKNWTHDREINRS